MNAPMISHDEVKQLLGAYALDAVDPDELIAVRMHFASCPRCATEVAEHQQVAGLLANSGGDAPTHLWELIAAQIERPLVEQDDDDHVAAITSFRRPDKSGLHRAADPMRRSRSRGTVLTGAAAAALVVIAALGVQVTRLDNRVGHLQVASQSQGLVQAAQSALNEPQARHVMLTAANTTGPAVAEIVILPSGTAFLVDSQLPKLPGDQTYQLWGRQGDQLISLGLLGSDPDDVAFRVDTSATILAFAITAEQAGGVVRSSHVPVAVSQTSST
jgi:hypothetical protein